MGMKIQQQMKKNGFPIGVAVALGFVLLCATPGLTHAQSAPSSPSAQSSAPAPVQTPHPATPGARPKKNTSPEDDFAGLSYTDEQKTKIEEIRKDTRARMDAVIKDDKLMPEQKQAMLTGLQRLEASEMFKVLTPEQQKEVRKKVQARRAAEQQKAQYPTTVAPH
jgi:Spy/CpxP family protein refolding chaperone